MKTFRKHNKRLLAIFVVALMIAFLLPATIRQVGNPNVLKEAVAEAYGEPIKRGELQATSFDTDILSSLAMAVPEENQNQGIFNWRIFVQFSQEPVMDYLLLVREAKHAGLEISQAQINQELEQQVPRELINAILRSRNISLDMLRDAVGNYVLVRQMADIAAGSVNVSEPELRYQFDLTNDRLNVAAVPMAAVDLISEMPDPTDQQLAAYYATHQEKFRFSDRVRVEYIGAGVDAIAKKITIAPELVEKRWGENKEKYTQPMTSTAPASEPAGTESAERIMTFDEAQPMVLEELKNEEARKVAKSMINEALRVANQPWTELKPEERNLGQADKLAKYREVADTISNENKVPIVYYRSALVSRTDARELSGIGKAYLSESNAAVMPFSEYAFRVSPLTSTQSADQTRGVSTLVPYENSRRLVTGFDPRMPEGYYFFRVVEVEPSRLPNSLDEVREAVAREWKLDRAYEQIQEKAEKLKLLAEKTKLAELIAAKKEEVEQIFGKLPIEEPLTETFARRSYGPRGELIAPVLPARIKMDNDAFAKQCFENLSKQPTTQPDGRFTTEIVEDKDGRTDYVVQLLDKEPALEKDYVQFRPWLRQLDLLSKRRDFYYQWFNPENIRLRTQYKPIALEGEQGETED
jgi:hypothetical protein